MNIFNTDESNQRGRLLFSSKPDSKGNHCEVYEHIPSEEELKYHETSEKEPLPFIKDLLKYKSREEHLLASQRFMEFINLAQRIHKRIETEKKKNDLN